MLKKRNKKKRKIDNLSKDCGKREKRKRKRLTIYVRIAEKCYLDRDFEI